jgi:hypothetical protein
MGAPPATITGHCLCGSVTYSCGAGPVLTAVCHCTDCQRQTGTAFSVVVGVPAGELSVQGDTLGSFTTSGDDHETERRFCTGCGSPIVSVIEAMPDLVFLKAGTLDDTSWLEPTLEVFCRSAQSWSPELAGARFEGGPS